MRELQSFYIFIYFTQGLSDGDACPLLGEHLPDVTTWAFGTGSPPVDIAAHDLRRDRRSRRPTRL
jgi:hypothetical protein